MPLEKEPPKDSAPKVTRKWKIPIWYILLAVFLMWIWQDVYRQKTVQTILYSDFKAYLARGEVAECLVKPDEIQGRIKPNPDKKSKVKEPKGPEEPFDFRTVRVEDRRLTQELEAAHVKFTGVRPGFFSEIFWAWIVPIGLMALLWWFLIRRFRA